MYDSDPCWEGVTHQRQREHQRQLVEGRRHVDQVLAAGTAVVGPPNFVLVSNPVCGVGGKVGGHTVRSVHIRLGFREEHRVVSREKPLLSWTTHKKEDIKPHQMQTKQKTNQKRRVHTRATNCMPHQHCVMGAHLARHISTGSPSGLKSGDSRSHGRLDGSDRKGLRGTATQEVRHRFSLSRTHTHTHTHTHMHACMHAAMQKQAPARTTPMSRLFVTTKGDSWRPMEATGHWAELGKHATVSEEPLAPQVLVYPVRHCPSLLAAFVARSAALKPWRCMHNCRHNRVMHNVHMSRQQSQAVVGQIEEQLLAALSYLLSSKHLQIRFGNCRLGGASARQLRAGAR